MARTDYPPEFLALVKELRRLPGIGPRSAERMALWLLGNPKAEPAQLAHALVAAGERVKPCKLCGFFSTEELCAICRDPERSGKEICVVERATEILPIERSGSFRGRYHALGGRLAPLDHVGPDDLRIDVLLKRISDERPSEIILATGADVEGEATAQYLSELLRPSGVKLTRIAQGIPAGAHLEQSDQITLARAIAGRTALPAAR